MRDVRQATAAAASSEPMMPLLLLLRRLPVGRSGSLAMASAHTTFAPGYSLAVPPTLRVMAI